MKNKIVRQQNRNHTILRIVIITDNLIDQYGGFLANSALNKLPAHCTEPALHFQNSCTLVHTLLSEKQTY